MPPQAERKEVVFESGKPYNFWRDVKSRYKLSHEKLRAMQRESLRMFLQGEETINIVDSDVVLIVGDEVAIKPVKRGR